MKKKILSALLTVIMIISMLSVMCPAALAAETLEVGKDVSGTVAPIVAADGNTLGFETAENSVSESANGITVTATLSEDKTTISLSYSGKAIAAGSFSITISYNEAGALKTHSVSFTATEPKIEIFAPEVVANPEIPLEGDGSLKFTQADPAVVFSVSATVNGEGTLGYSWTVDGSYVGAGTSFTLVPEDMTADTHVVECKVSNTVGNTSKHTTVTWKIVIEESPAPKITSEVTKGKIDGTGSASFVVTAEGDNLKYQWFMLSGSKKEKVVDGTYGAIEYAGATTNKLTVKCTMAPKDAATKFVCEVTGANGLSSTTEAYELKITEDPNADKVQELEIITGPKKTTYIVGETLDEDGLKIKVITGKDEEEITSGFVCSPLYLEEEGKQTITVSYGGKTVTFTVTVEPAPHEHEWSDWKVDDGETVKVYRECIAGDDCTAREVLSKDSFIVQFPTIADELGLTMDDDKVQENETDNTTGETESNDDGNEPDQNEDKKDKEDSKKNNGSGILWAIIIVALLLLAAVIVYYFLVYRKPYKKPTNNNRRR